LPNRISENENGRAAFFFAARPENQFFTKLFERVSSPSLAATG
jgi:hypothetical protein